MFAKFTIVFAALSFTTVFAAPGGIQNNIQNSCNTGSFQCCQSVHDKGSDIGSVLGLIGINLQDVVGQIGIQCVAGNGIGAVSGANCGANPVCCNETMDDTLIGLGCIPVSVQA